MGWDGATNRNYFKELVSGGFTNHATGIRTSDLSGVKTSYKGVCTGYDRKLITFKTGKSRMRDVNCKFETFNRSLDDCPVCGYALLWKIIKIES